MGHYASAQQLFAGALVFARIASMIMTMPGLGDTPAPSRVRLAFALLLCLVVTPVVTIIAVIPHHRRADRRCAARGADRPRIGAILRTFLAAMASAGEMISSPPPSPSPRPPTDARAAEHHTGQLPVADAALLVMVTDLHHLFIAAMVRSYSLFPFGHPRRWRLRQLAIRTTGDAFALGVQLAAPVLAFSLIFSLATGLVGRRCRSSDLLRRRAAAGAARPVAVRLSLGLMGPTGSTAIAPCYRRSARPCRNKATSLTQETLPTQLEEARKDGDVPSP